MKKLISVVLCLLLIVPCAFAEEQPRRVTEDDPAYAWLYEKSMEMAGNFQKSLNSPFHSFLIFPSQAERKELTEELTLLKAQDYSSPENVTIVCTDQPLADSYVFDILESDFIEAVLPVQQKSDARREMYHSTATLLSNDGDIAFIVISTSLTKKKSYGCPDELEGPCFAVMYYGGLYAYLTTFYPIDNEKVSVCGQVILSSAADELNLPIE